MSSMYELTGEWRAAFDALSDPDTTEAEAMARLDRAEADINEKADAYGKMIRMFLADAETSKTEASRLFGRAKSAENRADFLRGRLMDAMKAMGKDKLRTSYFTYTVTQNPPAVRITDLYAALESGYIKAPTEASLDKTAMKRDMEAGMTVPGAELIRGESLRMR